jgi:hypothetical protein
MESLALRLEAKRLRCFSWMVPTICRTTVGKHRFIRGLGRYYVESAAVPSDLRTPETGISESDHQTYTSRVEQVQRYVGANGSSRIILLR